MGLVSPTQVVDGSTMDAADVNNPINTLANEMNGNMDDANIKTGAAINPAKLAANSITSSQVNWTTSGNIWWQELGRTTLGVAGDSLAVSFTAKKYLKVICLALPSGTINTDVRFNSDSGTNYAWFYTSGSAGALSSSTSVSQTSIPTEPATTTALTWFEMELINVAAQEKLGQIRSTNAATTGAGTGPSLGLTHFKWANTAAQITSVNVVNTSTGDFAIGSELVVLGHD